MKQIMRSFVFAAMFLVPAGARAQTAHGPSSEAAPFGPPVMDQHVFYHVLFDQLEGRFGADSRFRWDGEAWAGTDANRLWLKSEGEVGPGGRVEDGQHEILYGRPITAYFDLLAGVRLDADSGPGRTWFAFGVEGLAPLFFHVAANAYVGDQGRFAAKLKGDYDLLLTQRLILQPQIEANLYAKSDPARLIGSGLADLDTGLRLRYEISREFAPYVAVTYQSSFGATSDLLRAAGEPRSGLAFSLGVRAWL